LFAAAQKNSDIIPLGMFFREINNTFSRLAFGTAFA
jgi:hypothetical protein